MAKQPKPTLDFPAWILLITGLLVAACVLAYDPSQVTVRTGFPPPQSANHLLGEPGLQLGSGLYEALGLAVYVFLAVWFSLIVLMFLKRDIRKWSLRLAGWVLLVPTVAALMDRLAPPIRGCPRCGAGGSIGAWLSLWLSGHFSESLAALFLYGSLVLGVVLALDFFLLGLWRVMSRSGKSLLSGVGKFLSTLAKLKRKPSKKEPKPEPIEETEPATIEINRIQAPVIDTKDTPTEEEEPEPEEEPKEPEKTEVPITRPGPLPESAGFDDYELPSLNLLEDPEPFPFDEHDKHLREQAVLLEKTFKDFDLNIKVVGINTGPVITQYEISLETGLRVNKVTRLADDIALNLKVPSVRMVAPIPGKNTVGVEVPNEHRAVVRLKEVILTAGNQISKMKLPLFLGKDTEGRPLVYDLAEMPHLLIAGRTGTGKSVCMNAVILSMLMTRCPDEVKMVMIDPKMLELSEYGEVPHLMSPVVKDMKKAEAILSWAVDKMEERYDILSRAKVRNIAGYNKLAHSEILKRVKPEADEMDNIPAKMPYIVIFVDEMGDLMMLLKKEVEGHIIRLAQKSRAAGIHLVIATQKPTVDVITGLIKSNLPARICFQVSSRTDSRVVLDEMGAEKLLGRGDMLFLQPGTSTLVRAQGTYASDAEITRVVEDMDGEPEFEAELIKIGETGADGDFQERLRSRDELYEQAIEVVVREQRGSVSLLQRVLGIGYGRAARLIDFMAEDGIVGSYKGSSAREVLVDADKWDQMRGRESQGVMG